MNGFMILSGWFFTCPPTPLFEEIGLAVFFDKLCSALEGPLAVYQEAVRIKGFDLFPLTVLLFTPG
jgi:hypothetical protein